MKPRITKRPTPPPQNPNISQPPGSTSVGSGSRVKAAKKGAGKSARQARLVKPLQKKAAKKAGRK